ncbi:hypothetical protein A5761_06945 [Mycolicibacterium setense]|uniref:hypothetical protein n=1 Tax=Mycolicibacterium setense TaxID=431269 RepID=UPI0007EA55DC|nr:hypothetical protein [Mycolicibacterium setense]OBB19068.1 hypothetical protein A5761_06945 [Mycolicibacterium setense]
MDPVYQADHTLLLALPAFAPAVVVVGVVVYVAMRDRRGEPRDGHSGGGGPRDDAQDERTESSSEDGSP